MVTVLNGVLVKCDPPIMMIIHDINSTMNFIIEQIDDQVVFCNNTVYQFLQDKVEKRLNDAERIRSDNRSGR
ncbi:ADP-ribosylation factor-like 2 [Babesia microti strain RI]|uniref:General transcription and DNA repair factor IIH subunit TFB5 n=1 Tax=Babesia microti (strain RI) TaxID=1133968 RepID=A0A1R4AAS1_BABMR|nr:ADP-ribosylation factor-like 2 [Babesia microti strain RI]SJK86085.1 ADP-ribosylation factor-like 2 [Babesia microti strain RI]|eukprot:XP_021338281.1 ADP-ribosylation factor-like 2 [Babesia microti strain RI]